MAKQPIELEIKSELQKNSYRTQEKIAIISHYQQHVTRKELCRWLDLPRSVSYYKPLYGKPGAKASHATMTLDGVLVSNEDVVLRIKQLIDTKFNAASADRFGYEYATHELKKEYMINKK